MKMFKAYLCLLGLAFVFQSCESDSPDNANDGVVITGYTITRDTDFVEGSAESHSFSTITGVVENNKLMSETLEVISDGVNHGIASRKEYRYQDGLLSQWESFGADELNQRRDFFYDSQGRLIGMNIFLGGTNMYYRYVHISDTVKYTERISEPYDSPTTEVFKRGIIVLDDNDNIIKAGEDYDLDGVMDYENTFIYSEGNLIESHSENNSYTYQYSNIVNNKSYINDFTYGRKNLRLINSELFTFGYVFDAEHDTSIFKNLLESVSSDGIYELTVNNFVKKRTYTERSYDHSSVVTVEYFFR